MALNILKSIDDNHKICLLKVLRQKKYLVSNAADLGNFGKSAPYKMRYLKKPESHRGVMHMVRFLRTWRTQIKSKICCAILLPQKNQFTRLCKLSLITFFVPGVRLPQSANIVYYRNYVFCILIEIRVGSCSKFCLNIFVLFLAFRPGGGLWPCSRCCGGSKKDLLQNFLGATSGLLRNLA